MNTMEYVTYTNMESPIGPLVVACRAGSVVEIRFDRPGRPVPPDWRRGGAGEAPMKDVLAQLGAYFAGTLRAFELPLAPSGTPFQREVWAMLQEIPYGTTLSYAELARRVGRPAAVRAVGAANGKNPLPIVVPCHRVVGSDGTLTGYAGGLPVKRALLALEGLSFPEAKPSPRPQMTLF